jgi:hypothetical protein
MVGAFIFAHDMPSYRKMPPLNPTAYTLPAPSPVSASKES